MLTRNDIITASGKYPERLKHPELTAEVIKNIDTLVIKVNAFLKDLGITSAEVSSGFRPSDVNAATVGAAKNSLHKKGQAVDLKDPNGKLDELIKSKPELLDKYELWLENPISTPTWTHLDTGTRTPRAIRIFSV